MNKNQIGFVLEQVQTSEVKEHFASIFNSGDQAEKEDCIISGKWITNGRHENNKYGSLEWVAYSPNGFRRNFPIVWCDKIQDDPRTDQDPHKYQVATITTTQNRFPNAGLVCMGDGDCPH